MTELVAGKEKQSVFERMLDRIGGLQKIFPSDQEIFNLMPGKTIFLISSESNGLGKTTTANLIKEFIESNSEGKVLGKVVSFATPLKEVFQTNNSINWDKLSQTMKNNFRNEMFQIAYGLGYEKIQQAFLDSAMNFFFDGGDKNNFIVVDDFRAAREIEFVSKLKYMVNERMLQIANAEFMSRLEYKNQEEDLSAETSKYDTLTYMGMARVIHIHIEQEDESRTKEISAMRAISDVIIQVRKFQGTIPVPVGIFFHNKILRVSDLSDDFKQYHIGSKLASQVALPSSGKYVTYIENDEFRKKILTAIRIKYAIARYASLLNRTRKLFGLNVSEVWEKRSKFEPEDTFRFHTRSIVGFTLFRILANEEYGKHLKSDSVASSAIYGMEHFLNFLIHPYSPSHKYLEIFNYVQNFVNVYEKVYLEKVIDKTKNSDRGNGHFYRITYKNIDMEKFADLNSYYSYEN